MDTPIPQRDLADYNGQYFVLVFFEHCVIASGIMKLQFDQNIVSGTWTVDYINKNFPVGVPIGNYKIHGRFDASSGILRFGLGSHASFYGFVHKGFNLPIVFRGSWYDNGVAGPTDGGLFQASKIEETRELSEAMKAPLKEMETRLEKIEKRLKKMEEKGTKS